MNNKILITENDKLFADSLKDYLNDEGFQVSISNSGIETVQLIRKNIYDVLLLDIKLDDLNGFDVCRRIRENNNIPIIFISGKSDDSDIVAGLGIGGDEYITKPFNLDVLLAKVKALLRRSYDSKGNLQEKILAIEDLELNSASCRVCRSGVEISLTKIEFKLLEYLLKNKGIVLSKEKILENVWGYDNINNSNSVGVYIGYLRKKINNDHSENIILTKPGFGYYIPDSSGSN